MIFFIREPRHHQPAAGTRVGSLSLKSVNGAGYGLENKVDFELGPTVYAGRSLVHPWRCPEGVVHFKLLVRIKIYWKIKFTSKKKKIRGQWVGLKSQKSCHFDENYYTWSLYFTKYNLFFLTIISFFFFIFYLLIYGNYLKFICFQLILG